MIALATASAAEAAVVKNLDWLVRPTANDIAESYPPIAQALMLEGRAVVSCAVDTIGRPRNCVVVREAPAGMGFGQSALEMTDVMRFSPRTVDGRPTRSSVQIPIRFALPEPEPESAAPPKPPADRASFVEQLQPIFLDIFASGYRKGIEAEFEKGRQAMAPAGAKAAHAALMQAGERVIPAWAQAIAENEASLKTPAELAAMVSYLRSDTGVAAREIAKTAPVDDPGLYERWRTEAAKAGAPVFCAKVSCQVEVEPAGIREPQWTGFPHAETIRENAPPISHLFGLAGWAQLNCIVTEDGALSTCITARSSPPELGFGTSAEFLAKDFVVHPESLARVNGSVLSFIVRFPAPPPLKAGPEPATGGSPEALTLARDLLEAQDLPGELLMNRTALRDAIVVMNAGSVGDAALDAMEAAVSAADKATMDYQARHLAAQFTTPQLKDMIAHETGPNGKANRRNRDLSYEASQRIGKTYARLIADEARRIFCANWTCSAP